MCNQFLPPLLEEPLLDDLLPPDDLTDEPLFEEEDDLTVPLELLLEDLLLLDRTRLLLRVALVDRVFLIVPAFLVFLVDLTVLLFLLFLVDLTASLFLLVERELLYLVLFLFVALTLQMFTGVYRVSAGKSECGDFKFMGIAYIPAIPVIFDINILCGLLISTLNYDFFFQILRGFQDTSNSRKIYMQYYSPHRAIRRFPILFIREKFAVQNRFSRKLF